MKLSGGFLEFRIDLKVVRCMEKYMVVSISRCWSQVEFAILSLRPLQCTKVVRLFSVFSNLFHSLVYVLLEGKQRLSLGELIYHGFYRFLPII